MNEILSAVIFFFSRDGTSLEDTNSLISSNNFEKFVPPYSSMKKVEDYFKSLGFQVTSGDVNLSITGKEELFNIIFKVNIKLSKHPQTGDAIAYSDREFSILEELRGEVSKIIFPEAPEFFP